MQYASHQDTHFIASETLLVCNIEHVLEGGTCFYRDRVSVGVGQEGCKVEKKEQKNKMYKIKTHLLC